jgi:LemA protein
MKNRTWIILALVVLIILNGIWWFISQYNRPIRMKEAVDAQWAQVENQLKRRYDLIPNLVETVKGYAGHEKQIFEDVAKFRNAAIGAGNPRDAAVAEMGLSGALKNLFAVAEAYPDLKANTNFLQLQQELGNTENEIQSARRYYNGAAREMNIRVESFPSNIVAGMCHFSKAEYFEMENPAERAVPEVKFS